MDYEFDETAGGRRLKILNVTDEFTREALASEVGRSIDAVATVKGPSRARRGAGGARLRAL
jgi:putative transposase